MQLLDATIVTSGGGLLLGPGLRWVSSLTPNRVRQEKGRWHSVWAVPGEGCISCLNQGWSGISRTGPDAVT